MSYYRQNRQEQEEFYRSYKWKSTREAYFRKAKGLCEVCLEKGMITQGEIVHHKIEMNSKNIQNEQLAFGFDNLQLVCRKCHAEIHEREKKRNGRNKRYEIDENGKVVVNGES